jgi:DNA-damage-inducible protein D
MTMHRDLITKLFRSFEKIAHRDGDIEFWLARELQELLGYSKWSNFEQVVDKAREACKNAGHAPADHLADVGKMVDLGSGAQRRIEDVALTRYAAYLIAQNGDPKKEAIAFAQSKGDAALFGGWTTRDMKKRLGVPEARALADFLPTITIKAKDLANEMTSHNVKAKDLRSERAITSDHVDNNRELRQAMGRRGIKPEELPADEDVRKLERRLQAEQKKLPGQVSRLEVDGEDGGSP